MYVVKEACSLTVSSGVGDVKSGGVKQGELVGVGAHVGHLRGNERR